MVNELVIEEVPSGFNCSKTTFRPSWRNWRRWTQLAWTPPLSTSALNTETSRLLLTSWRSWPRSSRRSDWRICRNNLVWTLASILLAVKLFNNSASVYVCSNFVLGKKISYDNIHQCNSYSDSFCQTLNTYLHISYRNIEKYGECLSTRVSLNVASVPRAYVTIKSGFSVRGEELASWCNSRLEWRYRWVVGVVGAHDSIIKIMFHHGSFVQDQGRLCNRGENTPGL